MKKDVDNYFTWCVVWEFTRHTIIIFTGRRIIIEKKKPFFLLFKLEKLLLSEGSKIPFFFNEMEKISIIFLRGVLCENLLEI